MSEHILLSEVIKKITENITNEEDRKKLGKEIQFLAESGKDGPLEEITDNEDYLVDPDKIFSWFNNIYKPLVTNSTELFEWKSASSYFGGEFSLNAYKPIPRFKKSKEIEEFIHKLEDENDDLRVAINDLQKQIKQQDCIIRKTCGRWAIHKVIDSAFYELLSGNKEVNYIEVFKLIKDEHNFHDKSSGESKKYDTYNHIESCLNQFDERKIIKWQAFGKNEPSWTTGRALKDSVNKLNKLNMK